ncbi:hypothetical protein BJ165DRAFT_1529273 [Panaeolus papilionaceus]|nr:hypothetical protein BJ165DRAFT_1529273 [Panaeolus papilionaceus]
MDSDASDRHYVTYCFLTVLQTKASRLQTYTDKIRKQLVRWDSLHNGVMHEILSSLAQGHGYTLFQRAESLFTIIDVNLSNAFSPAVSRKREQYRQMLERVGIPGQLLVMFEDRVIDSGLYDQEIASVPRLSRWQIFPDLHYHLGADVSQSCDNLPQPLCTEFGEPSWHDHNNLLSEFWESSARNQEESFQVEGFLRNLSFEVQDAVLFWLQQCILLLDPSEEASKSNEVRVVFDRQKEIEGEKWRAKVVARRLRVLQSFIWERCPLSADIVCTLERISKIFFPGHVASDIDDIELLKIRVNPALRTELLCSFSHPLFALPGWYSSPMPEHLMCYSPSYKSKGIHNYMRLYYIRKTADDNISDTSAIPAQFVARTTIDPVTSASDFVPDERHIYDHLVDYFY